jgi:hypothetical protein
MFHQRNFKYSFANLVLGLFTGFIGAYIVGYFRKKTV